MMTRMTSSRVPTAHPATPRQAALARTVTELEEHASRRGWDAPVAVYALVRTARALEEDPSLSDVLDDAAVEESLRDPEALTAIEQEALPSSADLEDLLGQLAWPESVDGVALCVERLTLPAQAEAEAATIEDPEERIEYLRSRPDRDEVRIVTAVLRTGESWCAIRSRAHDSARSVVTGDVLVPGLIEALASTLE